MINDEKFFRELLDNIYDGVYYTDRERRILYWNKGAERITGFSAAEVTGRFCWESKLTHVDMHGKVLCHGRCPLAACMDLSTPLEAEVYLHHKQGHRIPIRVRVSPLFDEHGVPIGGVEVFSDNSESMATLSLIDELQKEVMLDRLTGLPNRRCLENFIISRMDEMKRFGWGLGLIFLDIDHFKVINDRYGHECGDLALKGVADTLKHISRSFDTAGRWGGEEFVAAVVNVDRDKLYMIAERYRAIIESSDMAAGNETLRLTVSLGATLAQKDDTLNSLIQRADALMYRSKAAGRNRVTLD